MSLADTVRRTLVPIHREGYPFIAGFVVGTVVLALIWGPLFWIGLILTAWCVFFFRDPQRVTPVDDRFVVSPADGVVSFVGPAVPPRELGLGAAEMTRVSVFMNVFNCHVNRAPVRGRISRVDYRPGKFLNADLDKASEENERNGLVIDGPHGPLAVLQAGWRQHPLLFKGTLLALGLAGLLLAKPWATPDPGIDELLQPDVLWLMTMGEL